MKQAKVTYVSDTTKIDYETGELKEETSSTVTRLPIEPEYVKLYLDDLGKLIDLPEGQRKLLFPLARKMDYDGIISLTKNSRQRIATEIGITTATLRNYINHLSKNEVLIRYGQNEYEINPRYLAKGTWQSIYKRREEIELKIRYNRDGSREISHSTQKKENSYE